MLDVSEINTALKENFQRQLQDVRDLPEDLARGYRAWVQGLVKAAAAKMAAEAGPAQAQAQGQGQQTAAGGAA